MGIYYNIFYRISKMKEITLWHGGSLSNKPTKYLGCKNKWEYGPGLYTCTSYCMAKKYAKGNKKTSLISFKLGKEIKEVDIDINVAIHFIKQHVKVKFRKSLIAELATYCQKGVIPMFCFLNLLLTDEALARSKTVVLNQFLVDNGVDYILIPNYGFGTCTAIVIVNFELITQVRVVLAKDVTLDQYDLAL